MVENLVTLYLDGGFLEFFFNFFWFDFFYYYCSMNKDYWRKVAKQNLNYPRKFKFITSQLISGLAKTTKNPNQILPRMTCRKSIEKLKPTHISTILVHCTVYTVSPPSLKICILYSVHDLPPAMPFSAFQTGHLRTLRNKI